MFAAPSQPALPQYLKALSQAGVDTPTYNRAEVVPGILHLGAGNFHRAHQCVYLHKLLQRGEGKSFGIIGAGLLDFDRPVSEALQSQECLFTVTETDSTATKSTVVGSMVRYIPGFDRPQEVVEAIADPRIKIVTLTVTESGYFSESKTGRLMTEHVAVAHDLANLGTERPRTVFGYLAEGLRMRFATGGPGVTLLSCDNLQGNGDVLRATLTEFVAEALPGLLPEIERKVSFPNCMVDRITPRSTAAQGDFIRARYGVTDAAAVACEPYLQWVIEDDFVAGRPALEKVGVQFTEDVKPYELMKIRLLNAGHSAMGYVGYLLGYREMHEVALDPECASFTRAFMDLEATPTLQPLPDVDFSAYKDSLQQRFCNSALRDQVLRICSDGSGKIRGYILPIVRDCIRLKRSFDHGALVLASWLRFLEGRDEQGEPIPIEDPLAAELREKVASSQGTGAAVLEMREVFEDLCGNQLFRATVLKMLDVLRAAGVRGALRTLADETRIGAI